MYTMLLEYTHPPLPPPPPLDSHTRISLSTSTLSVLYFNNPLTTINTAYMPWVQRHLLEVWPPTIGRTKLTLKKTNSLLSPPAVPRVWVDPHALLPDRGDGTLTGLALCRSWTGPHSCCEIKHDHALSCPEDTVVQQPPPTTLELEEWSRQG